MVRYWWKIIKFQQQLSFFSFLFLFSIKLTISLFLEWYSEADVSEWLIASEQTKLVLWKYSENICQSYGIPSPVLQDKRTTLLSCPTSFQASSSTVFSTLSFTKSSLLPTNTFKALGGACWYASSNQDVIRLISGWAVISQTKTIIFASTDVKADTFIMYGRNSTVPLLPGRVPKLEPHLILSDHLIHEHEIVPHGGRHIISKIIPA